MIINVDENGTEIENVDWSVYKRVSVEEELDEDGNIKKIISHCEKYSDDELNEIMIQKLKATESEDIQAALCELAEQQASYEDDVNAALCELYELIEGSLS